MRGAWGWYKPDGLPACENSDGPHQNWWARHRFKTYRSFPELPFSVLAAAERPQQRPSAASFSPEGAVLVGLTPFACITPRLTERDGA